MLSTILIIICTLACGCSIGFLLGTWYEDKALRNDLIEKLNYEMSKDELNNSVTKEEYHLWLKVINIVRTHFDQ